MEITLTESNSLKIISGNYTLVTNPVTKNNYNVGLFNNPTIKSKNNGHLIINSPGEFEIGNFYITSIGYEGNSESENNTTQESQNNETNGTPVQQSLIDFEEQKTQHTLQDEISVENNNVRHIIIEMYCIVNSFLLIIIFINTTNQFDLLVCAIYSTQPSI